MNKILLFILFLLMIIIGRKKGLKVFFTIILNLVLLLINFYLSAIGLNAYIVSFTSCILFSIIVLFFMNGENIKTKSSFYSIIITFIFIVSFIFVINSLCKLGGFGYEEYEEINMFSPDIHLNMDTIYVSVVLIGLVGAIIDSSIAISSSLYEIYINNPKLSTRELFKSGMTIGQDILGTTANTLLFAFIGEFMTLILWFMTCSYSASDIINNKVFCGEFVKIIFSAISCIIVIPITSFITSLLLKSESYQIVKNN